MLQRPRWWVPVPVAGLHKSCSVGGGYNYTPSATDTMEALHARCKVAPPQPKREACVASMVTNVAAIRAVQQQAGWLAGWQPIVYSKTAARLLKAAWCLLRIATPCAVLRVLLRRLTEVAGRPAARCLHGSNLPPSHSSMSSVVTLLPFAFFLLFWPFGRNTISLKSELLWVLIVTISNFPPSFSFLSFLVFCLLKILRSTVLGCSSASDVLFWSLSSLFLAPPPASALFLPFFLFFLFFLFFPSFLPSLSARCPPEPSSASEPKTSPPWVSPPPPPTPSESCVTTPVSSPSPSTNTCGSTASPVPSHPVTTFGCVGSRKWGSSATTPTAGPATSSTTSPSPK